MRVIGQDNIAQLFGVTGTTIVEWQRDGFPVAVQGGRGVPNQYDTPDCIQWLAARERAKVEVESPRDRVFRLQGDVLERDLAEKAKLLVHVHQVEPKWRAAVLAAREYLMQQPAPLAGRLQGLNRREMEGALRASFDDYLRRLAAWRHADESVDDEASK
jgi:hypothetical protein